MAKAVFTEKIPIVPRFGTTVSPIVWTFRSVVFIVTITITPVEIVDTVGLFVRGFDALTFLQFFKVITHILCPCKLLINSLCNTCPSRPSFLSTGDPPGSSRCRRSSTARGCCRRRSSRSGPIPKCSRQGQCQYLALKLVSWQLRRGKNIKKIISLRSTINNTWCD